MLSGFWGSAPLGPTIQKVYELFCLWVFWWCGWVGCELYSGREHLLIFAILILWGGWQPVLVVGFF